MAMSQSRGESDVRSVVKNSRLVNGNHLLLDVIQADTSVVRETS